MYSMSNKLRKDIKGVVYPVTLIIFQAAVSSGPHPSHISLPILQTTSSSGILSPLLAVFPFTYIDGPGYNGISHTYTGLNDVAYNVRNLPLGLYAYHKTRT